MAKFKNLKYEEINDEIRLFVISKEQYLEIKEVLKTFQYTRNLETKHGIKMEGVNLNNDTYPLQNILAVGKTLDSSGTSIHTVLKSHIPYEDTRFNGESLKSYKCFSGRGTISKEVVVHENGESAVNCLMEKLRHPRYCIIVKK